MKSNELTEKEALLLVNKDGFNLNSMSDEFKANKKVQSNEKNI